MKAARIGPKMGYNVLVRAIRSAAGFALLGIACSAAAGQPTTERPAPSSTSVPLEAPQAPTPRVNGATDTHSIRIVDRPIRFGPDRIALTLAYRRRHVDPKATDIRIEPRVIVIHVTDGPTLESAFAYFDRPTIEDQRVELARAGKLNVSAHFLVDRDGSIYRLMPETMMARHTIGLNHIAIGIENVADGRSAPLTSAQLSSDADLARYLVGKYPITHLIGHHEYLRMQGHAYFTELDPKYRTHKSDPGPKFIDALRARLRDLALQEPPSERRSSAVRTPAPRPER